MNRNPGAGELELAGIANPRDRDRAELARRQAAAPLRASKPQAACDLGLFGDTAAQLDLVDQARAIARQDAPAAADASPARQGYPVPFFLTPRPGVPLLVLGCSEVKRATQPGELRRFGDLYDGPMWRQVRAAGFPLENVCAISALYGFLEPGHAIETYDRKMDADRAQRMCSQGNDVARLADMVRAAGAAFVVGGSMYAELARTAIRREPDLAELITFARGSYLEQRKQLGEWLRAHAPGGTRPRLRDGFSPRFARVG